MRLALFDDFRLGVVNGNEKDEQGTGKGTEIVDVTSALPAHDPDPVTAGWWRALCRGFPRLRPELETAAKAGTPVPLEEVRLLAPVLNPSKIVACASNYRKHVAEMQDVRERTPGHVESWMMNFDVFLKAPSAISGPAEDIVLPREVIEAEQEIHHESELVVVIGTGGKDIDVAAALDHVLGYTIGLDITVRSAANRSRRKSYDTFAPLGPWLTTADEAGDPANLEIDLVCNGTESRQHVNTRDLITPIPAIVSYASRMMTLLPGDVLFTGAPQGVGPIAAGDVLQTRISRLGEMTLRVRRSW